MPRSFPTRRRYLCETICSCDFCGGLGIVEVEDAERWCRNPVTVAAGSIVQLLLWSLGSLFLMPWMLRQLRTDPVCFLATAVTWGISTAWTVREPYVWARDIHVPGQDPEHFIRVTHVDPSIVIAVRKTVCVGLVPLIVAFIIL